MEQTPVTTETRKRHKHEHNPVDTDKRQVTKQFLENIKKILEVLTERTNLKYDEVLQIGPVFKELNDIID